MAQSPILFFVTKAACHPLLTATRVSNHFVLMGGIQSAPRRICRGETGVGLIKSQMAICTQEETVRNGSGCLIVRAHPDAVIAHRAARCLTRITRTGTARVDNGAALVPAAMAARLSRAAANHDETCNEEKGTECILAHRYPRQWET